MPVIDTHMIICLDDTRADENWQVPQALIITLSVSPNQWLRRKKGSFQIKRPTQTPSGCVDVCCVVCMCVWEGAEGETAFDCVLRNKPWRG